MDTYIGTIVLFAINYAPVNWALCNGTLVSVRQYPALFSILGTTYGGDGVNDFALPNLPTVAHTDGKGESQYIICLNGAYPSRLDAEG